MKTSKVLENARRVETASVDGDRQRERNRRRLLVSQNPTGRKQACKSPQPQTEATAHEKEEREGRPRAEV